MFLLTCFIIELQIFYISFLYLIFISHIVMWTRSRILRTLPTVYHKTPCELQPENSFINKPKHVAFTILLVIYYITSRHVTSHISYIIYHISYIMWRVVSCLIVSYHISYIISYITSHIIYHIIYHIISYITSHHITSHHITSHHIISYHIISYHIISYHIISYHRII